MRKKIIIILIPIVILLFAFLSVAAFYIRPLDKANRLLIAANKSDTVEKIEDNSMISQENYNKLRIIDRDISEDEYVQLKTNKKYKLIGLKNVDIICFIKATVDSFDKKDFSDSYTKNLKISFSFIEGEWIVANVDIID